MREIVRLVAKKRLQKRPPRAIFRKKRHVAKREKRSVSLEMQKLYRGKSSEAGNRQPERKKPTCVIFKGVTRKEGAVFRITWPSEGGRGNNARGRKQNVREKENLSLKKRRGDVRGSGKKKSFCLAS